MGDFKGKTVHTFMMRAHFPDVRMHILLDVALWIISFHFKSDVINTYK